MNQLGSNHIDSHEHGHEHQSRSKFVPDADECDCCPSSLLDHDHNVSSDHSHHVHGHEHRTSKDKSVPPKDDCECCPAKVVTIHDEHHHGHGHNHNNSRPGFIPAEDDCDCCPSKSFEGQQPDDHNHGHRHGHENSHGRAFDHGHIRAKVVPDEDDCECCPSKPLLDTHAHDHGHDHNHGKSCVKLVPEEDDCECCPGKGVSSHFQGDHDHGHGHDQFNPMIRIVPEEDNCDCCPPPAAFVADHDHAHGHHSESRSNCQGHSKGSHNNHASTGVAGNTLEIVSIIIEREIVTSSPQAQGSSSSNTNAALKSPTHKGSCSDEIHNHEQSATHASICSSCDPKSVIAHEIKVTRFRVANLCCAGEEKIIRNALQNVTGVEHIAINIIGRYAVIKHCPVECCAPSSRICDILNDLQLGVSIQDVAQNEASGKDSYLVDPYEAAHVGFTAMIFIAGLIMYLTPRTHKPSAWVFVVGTVIGILPILYDAFVTLFIRRTIDIHVLIVVAVSGALAAREFFDASLLVTLFIGAELLESFIMKKVQKAVNATSLSSMPKEAFVVGLNQSKKIEDLKIGDIIAVRTGEMISCDGVVKKGDGVVNEASITGESSPIEKHVGSKVLSGTVVQNGYLEIMIEKNPMESTWKQLEQAVADVQADRGYIANLVDSFAAYWTPAILLATLILIVVGGAVTKDWYNYLHRGLVLLVLACPCAIVISAPIPSVCAIAAAAKQGVLIRGSSVIEQLATVDTVAVDKTGTLTKGYFIVCEQFSFACSFTDDKMLLITALEAKSTHPLANAVVSAYCGCIAEANDMVFPAVRKVKVLDGIGLEGWVENPVDGDWKHLVVGNERLFSDHGGSIRLSSTQQSQVTHFNERNAGRTIVFVAIDDELAYAMSLADEIRPESKVFVRELQDSMNIEVTMLTGDQEDVAQAVCREIGIHADSCHARLLPAQKMAWVDEVQQVLPSNVAADHPERISSLLTSTNSPQPRKYGKKVLMIGDGVNDSTALAMSTVGVAMGAAGSAMAVQAANVVLLNDNLLLLPPAIRIARKAKQTIIENCSFAIGIKIVAIVLAITGLLQFWEAVLIDIGSLLVVVLNGLKLLSTHNQKQMFNEGSSSDTNQDELGSFLSGSFSSFSFPNALSMTSTSKSGPLKKNRNVLSETVLMNDTESNSTKEKISSLQEELLDVHSMV